jgi:hypothetical protein
MEIRAPLLLFVQAPAGELLPINVLRPPSSADVFRCIGCTKPECQVRRCGSACAALAPL